MVDNDEVLIRGLKRGLTTAQERFYSKYHAKVLSLCLRILRHEHDAEECCNQAFYQAMSKIKKFRGDSKLSSWLYRITFNTCLMHKRKHKKHETDLHVSDLDHDDLVNALGSYEIVSDPFIREEIQHAFNGLMGRYQTIWLMRDLEGFSNEQTAKILDISVPAVKSCLHRSRVGLKKYLEAA